MFDNTVKLVGATATVATTAVIDGPTNGRTMRASADGLIRLSIAHQETNENPGFTSQRSNVRVEQEFILDDTDKSVKAYAQITLMYPKGQVSAAQLADLASSAINFINAGENASETGVCGSPTFQTNVGRLYAGEP